MPRELYEPTKVGGSDYEVVAVGQTDQVLGGTGGIGDWLSRVIVVCKTAATNGVSIKDGAGSAIEIVPAGSPIGTYVVELGVSSKVGAWSITTAANASALAIGQFGL